MAPVSLILSSRAGSPGRRWPSRRPCSAARRRSPTRISSRDQTQALLLLELEGDTALRDRELDALPRRGQGHLDAVLVLERGHARAAADSPAGCREKVVAVEVFQFLEVRDRTLSADFRDAEVEDAQTLDRERVLLSAILEDAVAPAHSHADRDRFAFDGDLPVRVALRECGIPCRHEECQAEPEDRAEHRRFAHRRILHEVGGERKLPPNIAGLTDWGYSTKV